MPPLGVNQPGDEPTPDEQDQDQLQGTETQQDQVLPDDAGDTVDDGSGQRPQAVPYDRFSEVIKERNQLRDRIARFEAISQYSQYAAPVQAPQVAPQSTAEDDDRFLTLREARELARKEKEAALRETAQQQAAAGQMNAARESFFRSHPDLRKHDRVVRAIAAEVYESYMTVPVWAQPSQPELMDEVASKSRSYLADLRKEWSSEQQRRQNQARDTTTAPAPGAGQGQRPAQQPSEPATYEEFQSESLKERMEAFSKGRTPPR